MTTVVFLPGETLDWRWWRIEDGAVAARGDGLPGADAPVVAVAPPEAVTLHWATLPDRSPAQGLAAARVLVAEASAAPVGELHVAVGDEGRAERPIAVVATGMMAGWLTALGAAGLDVGAVIPAALLVPAPDEGFARAEIAGQGLVRGAGSGFADEARLTELLTDGKAPVTVPREAIEAAVVAAVARPPLDLRQGVFARRRRRSIDWALVRRLAVLALAVLAVTLAIDVVTIIRLNLAAGAAEARAEALARSGLPRGETVTDPDRQLAERLTAVRGPGAGFSATAAAVFAAVRSVPGSEVTALGFAADGTLTASLAVQREAAATDLKRAIEAEGFTVTAGTFQSANGRVTGQFTVRGG